MEIIVGKYSGFCNGVRHTVEEAKKVLEENSSVCCLGEIVHNERVIQDLEAKGMRTIDSIEEAKQGEKVIIRAHGERKEVYDRAKEKSLEVIDLTCGRIQVIRTKIASKKEDHSIIIIGKKNHPETLGVQSFSGKDAKIIEELEEIEPCLEEIKKRGKKKIYIVSQTTFNEEKFEEIANKIKKEWPYEITIDKTICDATSKRQEETKELSKKVELMLIIGGKKSSNTKELEVISKKNCKNVYLIQDKEDLKEINTKNYQKIGIMAGASTPENVVEEVISYLKDE